jgi:hypothetical protein
MIKTKKLLIAFLICWLVIMIEWFFYGTAYGGIFTIFIFPFFAAYYTAIAVGIAFIIGFLLRIKFIKTLWLRMGNWSIILSFLGIGTMLSASSLGLRSIDPESGYKLMPILIWKVCLVCIAFPIVNLPEKTADQDKDSVHQSI